MSNLESDHLGTPNQMLDLGASISEAGKVATSGGSLFERLPPEIRREIYLLTFTKSQPRYHIDRPLGYARSRPHGVDEERSSSTSGFGDNAPGICCPVLLLNKAINYEASFAFYSTSTFIFEDIIQDEDVQLFFLALGDSAKHVRKIELRPNILLLKSAEWTELIHYLNANLDLTHLTIRLEIDVRYRYVWFDKEGRCVTEKRCPKIDAEMTKTIKSFVKLLSFRVVLFCSDPHRKICVYETSLRNDQPLLQLDQDIRAFEEKKSIFQYSFWKRRYPSIGEEKRE